MIASKVCTKCGKEKPINEFTPHITCKTGRGSCRKCASAYTKRWRLQNLEYRKQWEKKNDSRIERRMQHNARVEAWRKLNPEKVKAKDAVHSALSKGTLNRQPCEVCGAEKVHAHHPDYSKPLDVQWLCPTHHAKVHLSQRQSQLL